jgi:hypothetical protein
LLMELDPILHEELLKQSRFPPVIEDSSVSSSDCQGCEGE